MLYIHSSLLSLVALLISARAAIAKDVDYGLPEAKRCEYLRKPKIMSVVLSAQRCAYEDEIREAKKEIVNEYRSARESGGGIIDKGAIYQKQEHIRALSARRTYVINLAKTLNAQQLPCKHKHVEPLIDCFNGYNPDACATSDIDQWKSLRQEAQWNDLDACTALEKMMAPAQN